ncbi:hypothetical protein BN1263460075 [Stenotrophomonas indicatrix]|nr:hypothetical protein BN1263460075 [Stenotrophomonas indicatrix]
MDLLGAAVAFDLGSALQRAEHRRGIRGAEAPMSERSEFGAVPWFAEKRRGPVRSTGLRTGGVFLWLLSLHEQRK